MSRSHKSKPKKWECREPRRRPYGATGTNPYCDPHDSCATYSVDNGAVRQRLKRELHKEPIEPEYDEREYVSDEHAAEIEELMNGGTDESV